MAVNEVRAGVSYNGATNTITVLLALHIDGVVQVSGVTNGAATLYDSAGTVLLATVTDAAPDAQGVFKCVFTPAPAFSLGETPTYFKLQATYSAVTYTTLAFTTFSRVPGPS